nr:b-box domain protein 31 [Quercus suber]
MGMESGFTRGSVSASSLAKLVMFTGILVETALEVELWAAHVVKPTEIRPLFKDSLANWDAGLFGKASGRYHLQHMLASWKASTIARNWSQREVPRLFQNQHNVQRYSPRRGKSAYTPRKCDKRVHGANFLALRHIRCFLCNTCQNLTQRYLIGASVEVVLPTIVSWSERSQCNSNTEKMCSRKLKMPFLFL